MRFSAAAIIAVARLSGPLGRDDRLDQPRAIVTAYAESATPVQRVTEPIT